MNISAPRRLALAHTPTPFRALERLSAHIGGPRIWLKSDDYTGAVISGNKIRKLEFLMAEAQSQNAGVILTCGGLQSNHCRATAAVSAQLGLRCHLLLRGPAELSEQSIPFNANELFDQGFDGNLLLDNLCGAKISIFSPKHYSQRLEDIFRETQQAYYAEKKASYCIPTGGSNAMGLWGYISAAEEIEKDLMRENISSAAIICASGSGGTQGGLSLGMHLLNNAHSVTGFAVCDSAHYFKHKIEEDVREWQQRFAPSTDFAKTLNISTNDGYIGPGYALGYPELFDCIRTVAQLEGVILDPVYTGKAFYGMLEEISRGAYDGFDDVVFVHTGGIFGLFPYKTDF